MPMYSEVEQAALAWSERQVAACEVTDQDYHKAVEVLGEQAVVDLTIAVNAINSWNRVARTFKPEVGSYKPS